MVGEDITVLTNPRESSCLEHVPNEPWYPKDVGAWSVRWVVVHPAAEGWPETPWIKPWTPAATTTS